MSVDIPSDNPYGGGTVDSNGNQSFPDSGGFVGGLSFDGGNYSVLAGAGSSYNSFTPSLVGSWFTRPPKPFRGLSQIQSGGSRIIASLNQLLSNYQSGSISTSDAVSQATQLTNYLSDANVFYQARFGKDANLLQTLRSQANSLLSSILGFYPPDGGVKPVIDNSENGKDVKNGKEDQSILSQISGLIKPQKSTNFETQPNLYSMTPEVSNSGAGSNMKNVIVLGVLGLLAFYLYKKYV